VSLSPEQPILTRRQWLRGTALAGAALLLPSGCARQAPTQPETPADALLRFPGKVPLRALNDRPPCLETPWEYFRTDITPNDAFYVRWHLQMLPTQVDTRTYRLRLGGHVEQPLELSLDELRAMRAASVVAVNQCSGNSRSFFEPRMPGGQWGNGGMGNARWRGVPLRDLLDRARPRNGAVEVTFTGLDRGGLPGVPDYTKSLPVAEARRADVLVAYEMNGEPLPLLNGFPLRLAVPGWYATYWVKALEKIDVVTQEFTGFWMRPAYRIPTTPNGVETPNQLAQVTVPINRMNLRSFFTAPESGARIQVGRPCPLSGIAFDGGSGIRGVEVSVDGGATWQAAELGEDLGPFSFRRWRYTWTPAQTGAQRLRVRATSTSGETQPAVAGWNRSGYMRNVIEEWPVEVV
jgi:DMSO/TMAO reductase YedYZ molybdopterin-dependent catalytic subunit